jgi:hypothetical protein
MQGETVFFAAKICYYLYPRRHSERNEVEAKNLSSMECSNTTLAREAVNP